MRIDSPIIRDVILFIIFLFSFVSHRTFSTSLRSLILDPAEHLELNLQAGRRSTLLCSRNPSLPLPLLWWRCFWQKV
jgi:hypothetical protein